LKFPFNPLRGQQLDLYPSIENKNIITVMNGTSRIGVIDTEEKTIKLTSRKDQDKVLNKLRKLGEDPEEYEMVGDQSPSVSLVGRLFNNDNSGSKP